MSVCLRIQYTRKLFMPTQKNCSVLLKAEFDINGTNSLRNGRCVLFPLLHAAKSNAAFTLSARLWYPLGTNVNTLFFQVHTLEFRHGAGVRVQGRDLALGHKKWTPDPFVHTVFVSSVAVPPTPLRTGCQRRRCFI